MRAKTSLYLDKKLYERFCVFAKRNKRTASAQLELLIEEALEKEEQQKQSKKQIKIRSSR